MSTTAYIIFGCLAVLLLVAFCFPRRKLFLRNRRPMTDSEYIAATRTPPDLADYALALREAMAWTCGIKPEFIHPTDEMTRLINLPLSWDAVGVVLRLEEKYQVALPDGGAVKLAEQMTISKRQSFDAWCSHLAPITKNTFERT